MHSRKMDGHSFSVSFLRSGTSYEDRIFKAGTPQITPQIILSPLEERVIAKIRENKGISRSKLAYELGVSGDTIKEYLEKLKTKGILRRVGPDRGGYWEVLKKK